MAEIGKQNSLRATRETPQVLYLDGGPLGEILLPGLYIPQGTVPGDLVEVFVYRDSEDRLVATTDVPLATVGEFALLRVVGVNRNIGAFLDWALPKDLLLPYREMENPVTEGEWIVVYVHLDARTERIYATTRLSQHLSKEPPTYTVGQPVDLIITRETPLGYVALVDRSYLGLLYRNLVPKPLRVGDYVQGYIVACRPDGKIDLTLESSGRSAVSSLSEQILETLERNGGRLDLDDDSPPEAIRAAFGASKKAFKQAIGQLYRSQRIKLEKPGVSLVKK
ncbi:MAG: GntR family transcriptional regulator [Verrucomicrobiaceae bacterium]|nr:GntR family transcriptional regulator [Verrucomicrobiaceae bacterium]